MSDLSTLLAPIRARAVAATEGPWHWRNTNRNDVYLNGARTRVVMAFSRRGMQGGQPEFRNAEGLLEKAADKNLNDYADAAFIASARTDIPRLLSALDAVEDLAKYLDTLAEGDQHYAALFRAAVTAALGEQA